MAEKKCPECKMMIDAEAKTCPHCRKKLGTSLCVKIALVLAVLMGIGMLSNAFRTPSLQNAAPVTPQTPQQKAKETREQKIDAARRACKFALLEMLHDPDSAKLKNSFDWGIRVNKDGTVLVQPEGRAKNAFGAYINSMWDCTAKGDRVISMKQIRP